MVNWLKPFHIVLIVLIIGNNNVNGREFERAILEQIQLRFGPEARQRIETWENLIGKGADMPEMEKLKSVNDFFNQNTAFIDDSILWQKSDYWATPIEFLLKGAGDCEDYSIAKYYTLLEMGIAENKMRITYVKSLTLNQAHMVLTYYESPQAIPFVLDNLLASIMPATERTDLLPVYSFNGSSLWLAKNKASGNPAGNSENLSLWQDLKQRALELPF
ncbi:sulfate adenylyltransferase [Methylomonas lenta]|uniref:Sulfate adenylyltransferase n=1 Tax=Methylomonas lenta TaxID=980561 RepID=A0A177NRE0_9GAMM|nr:transglutaminase-like cysteine peptidase [Methylomonas lenta]OAI20442.1 sulfate adenylyltransferase [Methylomonas lenta]